MTSERCPKRTTSIITYIPRTCPGQKRFTFRVNFIAFVHDAGATALQITREYGTGTKHRGERDRVCCSRCAPQPSPRLQISAGEHVGHCRCHWNRAHHWIWHWPLSRRTSQLVHCLYRDRIHHLLCNDSAGRDGLPPANRSGLQWLRDSICRSCSGVSEGQTYAVPYSTALPRRCETQLRTTN